MLKIKHYLVTAIALASAVPSALAQADSLLRCRAMPDPMARLACYDSLPVSPSTPAPEAPVASASSPSPTVQADSVVPMSKPADNFGLPAVQRKDEPQEVRSAVGSSFDGWGPNRRIRLDNGQIWQVIDGTSVTVAEGARKVIVKRGALGSYYLDFEGLNTSPRVRRVE